jgi:hypothetical protein
MKYATSLAERTIVAVDRFLELTMTRAWESTRRKVESARSMRHTSSEDEYGGDYCSLEAAAPTEDDAPLG